MGLIHMVKMFGFISLLLLIQNTVAVFNETVGKFPFLMPNVTPHRAELYLCTPIKVDYKNNYYIVGFEPNATMDTAHHMVLYGCGKPGSRKPVWNCGEMTKDERMHDETETPCGHGGDSQIIYAWARNAKTLVLPEGVGFKVGKDSPIKYLVLQVHYTRKFEDDKKDDSGIFIHYTMKQLNKLAGVLLLGTAGVIGPMSTEHMESACQIKENKIMYPFAYRTHTHQLGKVVSGYRVRYNEENQQQIWTQLGKRDPLSPQMFYPIENSEPIVRGDKLAARCTMESHRTRPTYVGATNDDEMCNFYIMYFVQNEEPFNMKFCFTEGPPNYYWSNQDTGLTNIPDFDASHL